MADGGPVTLWGVRPDVKDNSHHRGQGGSGQQDLFTVLRKGKRLQTRIVYPARLSFRMGEREKNFSVEKRKNSKKTAILSLS